MAVNGGKVVARWELTRVWLKHHTASWEPLILLENYKKVKTTEAKLLGLPAPSFENEPIIRGEAEEEEKNQEPAPADDDPPVN